MLWLDLSRKCQLSCAHCYNASGPDGDHGTMTMADWTDVLDQAAQVDVEKVQFIGGEPTLHPDFPVLVEHALDLGLDVEVYSNLVHVSERCWELFQRRHLSLATSYDSDTAGTHNAVTGRPSHARTRGNIERAVHLGIPIRVGVITDDPEIERAALRDLSALGVTRAGVDHVRPYGRAAHGSPDPAGLCGGCGRGKAAIGPSGEVTPCVFSGWMGVGNVRETPLGTILAGDAMAKATVSIQAVTGASPWCRPDDEECTPGFPGTECSPRR
jgi:MoaA/NifB/PqqE/SkfB family radical SAM enzyme